MLEQRGVQRGLAVCLGSLMGCVGAGDEPCPGGADPYVHPVDAATTERWCARPDGTLDGPYSMDLRGGRYVTGAYANGRAEGVWRWNFTQLSFRARVEHEATYRLGALDGSYRSYDTAGALVRERRYAAGVPCGTWREPGVDPSPSFPACATGANPVPPETVAPLLPPGWDGRQCPDGLTRREEPLGATRVVRCLRGDSLEGPYGEWRGAQKIVAGQHVAGLPDGDWTRWYDDGNLAEVGTWRAGLRQGPWRSYGRTGRLRELRTLRDDLPDGVARAYHEGGRPARELTFARGLEDGDVREWSPAGVVVFEARYAAGALDGMSVRRDADGMPLAQGRFARGLRDGVWETFHPGTAQRAQRASYEGGALHGSFEAWDREGRLIETATLRRGRYEGTNELRVYDDDGHAQTIIQTWANGLREGPVAATWDNGTRAAEGVYARDRREGVWRFWYRSGRALSIGTFAAGLATGAYEEWWDGDQRRVRATYLAGAFDGRYESWWATGRPREDGRYDAGRRVGVWTYTDVDGRVTTTDHDRVTP